MPEIRDEDQDDKPYLKNYDFGTLKNFVSGTYPKFTFAPNSFVKPQLLEVKLILSDDNPETAKTSTHTFKINVVKPPTNQTFAVTQKKMPKNKTIRNETEAKV